jgi:hypothetical protein
MSPVLFESVIIWITVVTVLVLGVFGLIKRRSNGKPKKEEDEGFLKRSWPNSPKPESWKKKIDEIRESLVPVRISEIPSPIVEGQSANIDSFLELPIKSKIGIELTNLKDGKRIVIVRGVTSIRPTLFKKEIFFFVWNHMAYYVKPSALIKITKQKGKKTVTLFKLVFHILISEPLKIDGTTDWDDELEGILVDSGMDQYIIAATFEQGFQLSPELIRILIIVGALGTFLGLTMNGVLHLTPSEVIHWLPRI